MKRGGIFLSSLSLFCLIASFSGVVNAQDAKTITVGHSETIRSMDPYRHTSITDWAAHYSLYDPLIYMNTEGAFVPCLATSWEIPDPTTYVFHLRKGVTFHNGKPFTARDVKYSIDRLYAKETAAPQILWWPKNKPEVTVVDDYTAKLTLDKPFAPLLASIWLLAILPEGAADDKAFFENPIGTGPFKFVKYVHGSIYIVEAYDRFWGGRPKVDRVVWRQILEPAARVAALLAGDTDLIPMGVPPEDLDRLRKNPKIVVQETGTTGTRFLVLNNAVKPFSDVRVRQAIWHAIDLEGIVDAIMLGTVGMAKAPMSEKTFGYPDKPPGPYPYDPEKARQLLKEAGYPNGFKTEYLVYSGNIYPKDDEVALAIQGMLGEVGIEVEILTKEIAAAIAQVYDDNFQIAKQGCMAATADFDLCAALHYGEKARCNYTNPELIDLLAQGAQQVDPADRRAVYAKASEILKRDAPNVWLFDEKYTIGHSARIKGLQIHPTKINAIREQVSIE
jgi:peptide/nickel transport system substrate-binding protein